MPTFTLIASSTVGSGGAATISFTSIPATFTDLVLKFSGRLTTSGYDSSPWVIGRIYINGTEATSGRLLFGTGSATGSDGNAAAMFMTDTDATALTFSSAELYLTNYTSSTSKSMSVDVVTENNGTAALAGLQAVLSGVTAAVTSITLYPSNGSGGDFAQHSTAYLYGVSNA
jgi:hypothetical protein